MFAKYVVLVLHNDARRDDVVTCHPLGPSTANQIESHIRHIEYVSTYLDVSLLCGFNEVPHLKEQMYTKFNWYAKPSEGRTHDAGVMKMQTTLKNQEE